MELKITYFKKQYPLLYNLTKHTYIRLSQFNSKNRWNQLYEADCIKLELGSGPKKGKDGWITVDLHSADINHNLINGIPLKNCSVDAIYTSHMFEHIPFNSLVSFISECKRVLKVGSVLSVSVPNAGLYIRAYLSNKQFLETNLFYKSAIVDTNSYIDQVNYIAYMDGQHHYLFDEQNLVNTLIRGGFNQVQLREFDPLVDNQERKFESIYANAIKT